MAFGFGFGLPRGGNTIWSPASLFAQNEPGVWYDPSDMTTLFQDAAGTTPVTAVEQAVGLMLDKSRGPSTNGAYRYNLLAYTEQFDNAAWTASKSAGASVTANTTVAPDGTLTADTVTFVSSADYIYQALTYSAVSGQSATISIYARTATQIIVFGGATPAGTDAFTATSVGSGWFRQVVTRTFTVTTSGSLQTLPIGTFVGAGSFPIWGAQLQAGSTTTTYQKITADWPSTLAGTYATSLTTSRPVLTARVNIFTETEFRNGVSDAPTRGGLLTATTLTGYLGALAFGYDGVTGTYAYKNFTHTVGINYTLSVVVQMTDLGVPVPNTNTGLGDFALVLFGTAISTSTTALGGGLYRITASGIASGTTYNWGVVKYATQSTRTFKVTAYSLTTADQASLGYQRVNTATDYDTVGFPMWLKADGVDDYMVTGTLAAPVNLNLTSTDKVTVVTGVRKLSDAALGMLTELGTGLSTQIFYIAAPRNASTGDYEFRSAGTSSAIATTTNSYAAPITNVLTGIGDISGDLATLRINGAQVAQSTADQGTGNYGTYPLYQFRRAGTSLPFNGLSAGLTVVGRTLTAAELSQLETYYQQKTKAY